ncbi:MAG: serine hydroxymethyltransferase [Candidatus Taylorbacteria bacterium RIFCSPHIGHO2_02_FULL_47_18]|uniref:Serine hydroxymethyltransferase n=1 Tax=Candidatus Taylorbacteria bacterium RIFCSPLOWO2_01_FULL_48_100 TaxID=1802322 RepID=A0A1G2NEU0_9BACT|nr:MAG: serine hydroxymethyltransferase [Candidatus Taylorbacteria bacterium RIFCSPHIGHO2_01_FULL_48_38]OHA27519.1 MAG: serine hydroxymethyltransferase [Candidatus Taylorbacteria bacterium RIFCSPHIGHO2_02_FULL_47_18]OHA34583.1 MAG: serine hydroxymethyltransferase [Candidatus Taylorbacteria bacterium RIFCSPLOWO2_01_FULL_48_100]OHA40346.1 MAG: serine hydroxymethyltransferase [Candidatus Taylorbacteria bacterium RIFCSPLOWO2_02_FULL_48_16]OHA45229.1 MAG: serine hydroxymethyltransferase [Candidatus 
MKDLQIKKLMDAEKKRQKSVINLIASENYVSKDVLEALGSELTNKYGEGYPGKRYYRGCAVVDEVERAARKRALDLFGLTEKEWGVNVQPLSGSPANFAVYAALVPIGGKVMGMSLDHGGHLTHGQPVSMTGKVWKQVPYGLDKETERLDYEHIKKIATENKPALIVAGFTAYAHIIDFKKFREIADLCNAILMVDMSHFAGLVAGGEYPSPFAYADIVTTTTHKTLRGPRSALIFSKEDERKLPRKIDKAILPGLQGGPHFNQIAAVAVALKEASTPSFKKYAAQVVKNARALADELQKLGHRIVEGGTETHLLRIDTWLGGRGIGGREAADKLEAAGIIVSESTLPFDTRGPVDPSGIRLGSAAETTRGKKEKDFIAIARKVDRILRNGNREH